MMPLQGAPSKDDLLLNREMPLKEGGPDPEKEDRVFLVRNRVSRIFFLRSSHGWFFSTVSSLLQGFHFFFYLHFAYHLLLFNDITKSNFKVLNPKFYEYLIKICTP